MRQERRSPSPRLPPSESRRTFLVPGVGVSVCMTTNTDARARPCFQADSARPRRFLDENGAARRETQVEPLGLRAQRALADGAVVGGNDVDCLQARICREEGRRLAVQQHVTRLDRLVAAEECHGYGGTLVCRGKGSRGHLPGALGPFAPQDGCPSLLARHAVAKPAHCRTDSLEGRAVICTAGGEGNAEDIGDGAAR
jgi:hypothetical protein